MSIIGKYYDKMIDIVIDVGTKIFPESNVNNDVIVWNVNQSVNS
jgi:hypothetical protein